MEEYTYLGPAEVILPNRTSSFFHEVLCVATPLKDILFDTRSAMGMPGSETCLEELMSRVLGDLIQEGCVAKFLTTCALVAIAQQKSSSFSLCSS